MCILLSLYIKTSSSLWAHNINRLATKFYYLAFHHHRVSRRSSLLVGYHAHITNLQTGSKQTVSYSLNAPTRWCEFWWIRKYNYMEITSHDYVRHNAQKIILYVTTLILYMWFDLYYIFQYNCRMSVYIIIYLYYILILIILEIGCKYYCKK